MKKWIPAALAAGAVIALGASSWYCGLRAEQAIRQQLAEFNAGPAFKLELGSYQRGLFRSQASVKVSFVSAYPAFASGEQSPTLFEHAFTVIHGPILWDSAFAFRPAAFAIKTHLDAQPDWPQDFKTALVDERVRLTSRVGFMGATSSHLRIADGELQLSSGTLHLHRGDLQVDYDPSDKSMTADFNWPGLQFKSEMGELDLKDMGFHWAGTYYSPNIQIGNGDYHLGSIRAKQGEAEAFAMNHLKMAAKQALDSAGKNLNSAVDMALADVTFLGEEMLKNGSLHLELNNLPMAALQKLDEHNTAADLSADQMQTVLTDVVALFQHGAELKIDPLKAQLQGQPLELTLLAKLPVATADTGADLMALFQQAEVDMTINAGADLLAAWAPADMLALAEQSGKPGQLIVQVRQGKFTVNDQPYEFSSASNEAESSDWADDAVREAEQNESSEQDAI